MPIGSEYYYLPVLVLAFLVLDLFIDVKSLPAILGHLFFWLYWLIYSAAAETALYFLHRTNATNELPRGIPNLLLAFIAIVSTTTVLQSLTLKFGGKPVLDFSRYLDEYRRGVLSSSGECKARFEKRRVLKQSGLILKKVNYNAGEPESESRMKAIYADAMLFGARDPATVNQEIVEIRQNCANSGGSFGALIASRVAQTDPEWVRNFLRS
ncbi:MAG: hypothetical protein ABSA48_12175 [Terracidiphilus sp.]|jgi:hypothetical protein